VNGSERRRIGAREVGSPPVVTVLVVTVLAAAVEGDGAVWVRVRP
jgi:hypothetical protein